ncbi:MAG: OmpA family protein [Thiobacillaceae bacterium]
MPTKKLVLQILAASLVSAGVLSAQAEDRFYDPTNAASPTGYTIGYKLIRTIGCPGRDLLGVPCPVPKPVDTDGDGVVDSADKCPNTPTGRKVNADGCELDSDGDGVMDGADKCPNTPAGRKVNSDGCELDSDGDGVVDGADACPTVYAKTANGCPLPLAPPQKLILEGVNFDYDQATLRPQGFEKLDLAAATLKEWGNVKVEVAGHTDSIANDNYNLELSDRRAKTVRDYLINKGIAPERLISRGYGESQPIGDNATEEGRLMNRRVELNPLP